MLVAGQRRVERCLRHGLWVDMDGPTDLGPMRYQVPIRKKSMDCHAKPGMRVLRRVWSGDQPYCSSVLHSPLNGTFDGIFANVPVSIFVLSDSIGQQVLAALHGAQRANPHLHALTFASASPRADQIMHPLNLGLLPRTTTAAHALLDSIQWPRATPAARRIVVAGSAAWYNLLPLCDLSLTSFQQRCDFSARGRPILDHDDPFAPPRWPHEGAQSMSSGPAPIWGWSSFARRTGLADGSGATINEYEDDLSTFLKAATAQRTNATLVWFEHPPEHRSFIGGNMTCSAEPSVLMPSELWGFAHSAHALCPNATSVQDFLKEPWPS